ncbi:hypothetical protein NM688_g2488 [Phlebia brevispora]|uniref:Uncharacterized protein n=1 Tax=Phlebia brevispora TaxID=194682 RepID=A0ACC1T875_9APHY|nr:hypothetical protein NM688_g2488 [Phlebia brevispora]
MSSTRPVPKWPSLYNFLIEIEPIEHRRPVQSKGFYLYDPNDIYRFTLYWTLIFYTPAFLICGIYAFLNLTFTPHSRVRRLLFLAPSSYAAVVAAAADIPLRPYPISPSPTPNKSTCKARSKPNERRSRLTFAVLVALTFAICAVGGAVVGSAIMGYVMAGLFKAAHFNMSTWIPFFLGLIQTLVGLLGLWPSVVDII